MRTIRKPVMIKIPSAEELMKILRSANPDPQLVSFYEQTVDELAGMHCYGKRLGTVLTRLAVAHDNEVVYKAVRPIFHKLIGTTIHPNYTAANAVFKPEYMKFRRRIRQAKEKGDRHRRRAS